jgi:hypothetical protein
MIAAGARGAELPSLPAGNRWGCAYIFQQVSGPSGPHTETQVLYNPLPAASSQFVRANSFASYMSMDAAGTLLAVTDTSKSDLADPVSPYKNTSRCV